MFCLGILWNSMFEFKDEVFEDISKYGEIKKTYFLDLGNDYEQFVRDIYSKDTIAEWKVNKKIETMFACTESRIVTVVILKLDPGEIEYHPLKKRNIFRNIEDMKINIREKYRNYENVYFFDNLFHATDDEKEFKDDLDVIKKYLQIINEKKFSKKRLIKRDD